jgi:DNA polymerase-2
VEGLAQPDDQHSIEGFLGARFSRDKHCLPGIVSQIWHGRDEAKRQHNKPLSQALKIIMNAFYGVLGTSACRFFDPRLASSITMRGHAIMRQTKALIEAKGYDVIYGDTDSTFVWLKRPHSEAQAAEIGRELVSDVNAWWAQELGKSQLTSALELEYETHFCRFLMPTIRGADTGSKKRYAGMIQEGDAQRMVFQGLETVRTDWTPLAQQFQQELYLRIFRNQPYQDYVRETIARLMNGELDEQLVYRKRLRRPLAEYQRNVPPHVRAARLADEHNLKLGGRSSISSAAPSNTSGPPAARSRWIISSRRSITITIFKAVAAGGGRDPALRQRRLCYNSDRTAGAILIFSHPFRGRKSRK